MRRLIVFNLTIFALLIGILQSQQTNAAPAATSERLVVFEGFLRPT